MNFFFDRCVPIRMARVLDTYDAENTITHHDDDNRFSPSTKDVELIHTLASDRPKPVFVTADEAMKRVAVERTALADSGLTIIFLRPSWNELDFHRRTVILVNLWPDIVKHVERCREPTVFEITSSGRKAERLCLTRELMRGVKRKPKRKR